GLIRIGDIAVVGREHGILAHGVRIRAVEEHEGDLPVGIDLRDVSLHHDGAALIHDAFGVLDRVSAGVGVGGGVAAGVHRAGGDRRLDHELLTGGETVVQVAFLPLPVRLDPGGLDDGQAVFGQRLQAVFVDVPA